MRSEEHLHTVTYDTLYLAAVIMGYHCTGAASTFNRKKKKSFSCLVIHTESNLWILPLTNSARRVETCSSQPRYQCMNEGEYPRCFPHLPSLSWDSQPEKRTKQAAQHEGWSLLLSPEKKSTEIKQGGGREKPFLSSLYQIQRWGQQRSLASGTACCIPPKCSLSQQSHQFEETTESCWHSTSVIFFSKSKQGIQIHGCSGRESKHAQTLDGEEEDRIKHTHSRIPVLAFSLVSCQMQAPRENSQNDILEKTFFNGLESLPPSRTICSDEVPVHMGASLYAS